MKYTDLQFEFSKNLLLESGDTKFRFVHGYQIENGIFTDFQDFYEGICEELCNTGDEKGKLYSSVWDWYEKNLKKNWLVSKIAGIFSKEKIEPYDKRWGDLRYLNKKQIEEIVDFVQKAPEKRDMSPLYRKELWRAEREIAARQESIQLKPEEILVYGHTHKPFCEKDKANTGSWVSDAKDTNSYLIIDEGKMELKYWE